MINNATQKLPYAYNATITTGLSRCDQNLTLTQTVQDLYDLYKYNTSIFISSLFSNVSITNYDCNVTVGKYFDQFLEFTSSISIRTQIELTSLYYDFIATKRSLIYGFHGLYVGEGRIGLTSITLNFTSKYSACISGDTAGEPLCRTNTSLLICNEPTLNPWIFNCSSTPIVTPSLNTTNNVGLLSTTVPPFLNAWQISLISVLAVAILLLLLFFIGCLFRRRSRSKRVTFTSEDPLKTKKSMEKSGIPYGQAFQRTDIVIEQKKTNLINPKLPAHNGNLNNIKSSIPYNKGAFINHPKIHHPVQPSKTSPTLTKPKPRGNNQTVTTVLTKVPSTVTVSRPVSGTSANQLKSIIDGLEEDTLNESDSISLDRSNTTNPKKPSTPVSRQFVNGSFVDESLHDEDAWMSILAIANAELDVLNRMEPEHNRTKTPP